MLVRRVLGRAEQRKKCEGQMETLERLRGVREHVQEEADAFITEVRIKINVVVAMLNSDNRGYLDGYPLTQIGGCCSFALFRCALCC